MTYEISTVRVHLTSIVARDHVDLGLVNETDDLNVIGGLGVLDTVEGASGDETSTVLGLGAPCDHDTLDITNLLAIVRGGPQAEVYNKNKTH